MSHIFHWSVFLGAECVSLARVMQASVMDLLCVIYLQDLYEVITCFN